MARKWVPGRADLDNLSLKKEKGKLKEPEERELWVFVYMGRGLLTGSTVIDSSCSDFIVSRSWVGEQEVQREGLA